MNNHTGSRHIASRAHRVKVIESAAAILAAVHQNVDLVVWRVGRHVLHREIVAGGAIAVDVKSVEMRVEDGAHPIVSGGNVDTALLRRGKHGAEIEVVDMACKRLRLGEHIGQILAILKELRHFVGGVAFGQNHDVNLAFGRTVDHNVLNRKHIALLGGVEDFVRLIQFRENFLKLAIEIPDFEDDIGLIAQQRNAHRFLIAAFHHTGFVGGLPFAEQGVVASRINQGIGLCINDFHAISAEIERVNQIDFGATEMRLYDETLKHIMRAVGRAALENIHTQRAFIKEILPEIDVLRPRKQRKRNGKQENNGLFHL